MTLFKLHLKPALLCAILLVMTWDDRQDAPLKAAPTPTATPVPVEPTATHTATPTRHPRSPDRHSTAHRYARADSDS